MNVGLMVFEMENIAVKGVLRIGGLERRVTGGKE